MSQSRRTGRTAASATLGPATVDVGAEELEAGGDLDVSVKVAVVGDDRRRMQLDVVTSRADAVEVFVALTVDAVPVGALVGGRVPHEAVRDRRRRPVDGRAGAYLVLTELVLDDALGWPAPPPPQRTCSRRPSTAVLVRFVVLETREDGI